MAGLAAVAKAAVLAAVIAALGRRLARRLLPGASAAELSCLGLPLGLALVMTGVTLLLAFRLPVGPILLPLLAAGLLWSRAELPELPAALRSLLAESRWGACLVAAQTLLGIVGALAPATGWDTGVYHFAMARLRAEDGSLLLREDIPHGYRPMMMESLHTLGFILDGERLASLMNTLMYLAGFGVARLWGLRLAGEPGRLVAGLAWLSSVTYVLRMDGGDVEVGQAVYFGTAAYALDRLRDSGGIRWRVLAGLGLGAVLGMKYAGAWALLAIALAWAAVRLGDRAPLRSWLADGAAIPIVALAIGFPWYLRNHVLKGQLFYPLGSGSGALGGGGVESGWGRALGEGLGLDALILAAFPAAALGLGGRSRWIGAVAVLFAAFLFRQMGLSAPGLANALRYASPGWILLLALASAGLAAAVAGGGLLRGAALAVLGAALGLSIGINAWRNLPKVPVVLGEEDRETYLSSRINSLAQIRQAERGGGRILLVEQRVYYCNAPFLAASDIQARVGFDAFTNAEEFRRFLDRESIRWIVVNKGPSAKTWGFQRLERRLGGEFASIRISTAGTGNEAVLYRVD